MSKRKTSRNIDAVKLPDLAYAVRRLVAMRKVTEGEVLGLAAEREKRIAALQAELQALRGARLGAPVAVAPRPAPMAAKKVVAAPPARKARMSSKQARARKIQGEYMGLLRNFAGAARQRIKATVKAKGVPAGLAAMKGLLAARRAAGAKPVPAAKPAPKAATRPVLPKGGGARPKAMAPASGAPKRKAKVMPADYYRCAHPGCTKNWFVRGRPYCGAHAKLHAKRGK
jgi:hypothetical protein